MPSNPLWKIILYFNVQSFTFSVKRQNKNWNMYNTWLTIQPFTKFNRKSQSLLFTYTRKIGDRDLLLSKRCQCHESRLFRNILSYNILLQESRQAIKLCVHVLFVCVSVFECGCLSFVAIFLLCYNIWIY